MTVREVYEALVSLLEKRESYNFIIYKNTYSEKEITLAKIEKSSYELNKQSIYPEPEYTKEFTVDELLNQNVDSFRFCCNTVFVIIDYDEDLVSLDALKARYERFKKIEEHYYEQVVKPIIYSNTETNFSDEGKKEILKFWETCKRNSELAKQRISIRQVQAQRI